MLKTRRVAGIETLILGHPERGSFSIAREWTDWAPPSANERLGLAPARVDIERLLELVALVEQLATPVRPRAKEVDQ